MGVLGIRSHLLAMFMSWHYFHHARYDTGVVGGALLFIVPEFGLESRPLLQGWIVTASVVGSLFGTLASSHLSDTAGRRGTMRCASALFVTAALLLAWSPSVRLGFFFFARQAISCSATMQRALDCVFARCAADPGGVSWPRSCAAARLWGSPLGPREASCRSTLPSAPTRACGAPSPRYQSVSPLRLAAPQAQQSV